MESLAIVEEGLQEKYGPEGTLEIAYQKASAWPTVPREKLHGQDVRKVGKMTAGSQNRSATAATAAAGTSTMTVKAYRVPPVLDFDQDSADLESLYAGDADSAFDTADFVMSNIIGNLASRADRDYFGDRGGEIGQIAVDPGVGTDLQFTTSEEAHNVEVGMALRAVDDTDYWSAGGGTIRAGTSIVATVPGTVTGTIVTVTAAINAAWTVDDYIVQDGDHTFKRAGLADWNPADTAVYDLTVDFYGVTDRDTNPEREAGTRTTDTSLTVKEALDELLYQLGNNKGEADLCWMSWRTAKQFAKDIGAQSPDSEVAAQPGALTKVGYKSFKYYSPVGAVDVMPHRYCKPNQVRVLKKDQFKMAHFLGEPVSVVDVDGRKLRRVSGFTYGMEATSQFNFFALDTRSFGVATLGTVT